MKLGSVTSQWKNTVRGCPQGSSFGHLLWKSYAFRNDLAYITEEEISIYADDHQIFASGSSTTLFFFYKNVVFPAQAEYSYFSADFRLKIFLYYS